MKNGLIIVLIESFKMEPIKWFVFCKNVPNYAWQNKKDI